MYLSLFCHATFISLVKKVFLLVMLRTFILTAYLRISTISDDDLYDD